MADKTKAKTEMGQQYDAAMARQVLEQEMQQRREACEKAIQDVLAKYKAQLIPELTLTPRGVARALIHVVLEG